VTRFKLEKMYESHRIEFKLELSKDVDIEKEVIAFLNNHEGGVIYIGIDKNGKPHELVDLDGDMLKIKDRLKTNIQPSCLGLFNVLADNFEGKNIIKIEIASGTEKPYYRKKKGMSPEGCYIRIGTASEPMEQRMIHDLYSKRTRNSIGKIKSNRQDLTFNQLKIYYEGVGLPLNSQFAKTLDLLTEDGLYNYVAYLLADSNSTSIKVAKYAGTDKNELIQNEEYGFCSLIKATERVLDKLVIENKTFAKITGAAQRLEKNMINKRALREAFINAIVHNDYTREVAPVIEIYSDRLTITSYGGLVDGLSIDEFFKGLSIPRNRELMRIFRDLDYVEQLGSGIHRILMAYPQDIFKITENFLVISFPFEEDYLATIKSIPQVTPQVTPQVESLMKVVNGELSRKDIQEKLGLLDRKNFAVKYLNPALDAKVLEMTFPDKPRSSAQKYRLSEFGKSLIK
jgi:ATP-dependent DNA helicase RecG